METQTTDVEIREALHRKLLRGSHRASNTLVIDELGLAHGKARVDVAVLNGWVHGYEIKSSQDTIRRFDSQMSLYSKCLEKVTIVSAEKHLAEIMDACPDYFGIVEVRRGKRGAIQFFNIRKERVNPDIDAFLFAHLLWKDEAIVLLQEIGMPDAKVRASRSELYRILSEELTIRELSGHVKKMIMRRDTWRDPQRLVSYDDSYPLTSTS